MGYDIYYIFLMIFFLILGRNYLEYVTKIRFSVYCLIHLKEKKFC